jgi:phage nucleotide-binding protein
MTLKIYDAKDILLKHLSWLLFGRSGAGKTTLAATFPGPILLVTFTVERGEMTLRGHPGVKVLEVGTPTDMNEALQYIMREHAKYRTIVIDSLTSFVDVLYRTTKVKREVNWDDWRAWKGQVFAMVEALRALPCEIVYTAILTAVQSEMSATETFGGPAMFKSLEQELPARMEAVIYLEAETSAQGVPIYKAYLWGKGKTIGRVRGTRPSQPLVGPTYQRIMEAISKPLFAGKAEPEKPEEAPAPAVPADAPVAPADAPAVGVASEASRA